MFYSLLVLCYIILLQIFIVRPFALSFVKLNYEDELQKKKNIIKTSVYLAIYLATLACRIIVKVFYFQVSLYVLLDVLVFFGMFALYSDFYKRDRKFWDLNKRTELIFEIITLVLFAVMTVLLLVFRKDLTNLIYHGQLIPAVIAGAVFIVMVAPIVVFFAKSIKKFRMDNPPANPEDLTRTKIREKILFDNAVKELDERIASGDEFAVSEKVSLQAEFDAKNSVVAKRARCFTTTGKILIMVFALVILGLNFGTSYLSQYRYYSVEDTRIASVVRVLEQKGYDISDSVEEEYDYLTEREVSYKDAKSVSVSKNGETLAKIYFGKLNVVQTSEEYNNELKKFNSIYSEGYGFKMNETRYVAYGRNLSDKRSIYSCFIRDEIETDESVSGFFFVESENNENAFEVFWSIKARE